MLLDIKYNRKGHNNYSLYQYKIEKRKVGTHRVDNGGNHVLVSDSFN